MVYSGHYKHPMFYQSKDLLNYALTVSVIVLTFFTAWILAYIVGIFREVQKTMKDVRRTIEKFEGFLEFTKDKISNAAAIIPMIIKGSEKVADMVQSVREKRSQRDNDKKSQNKK